MATIPHGEAETAMKIYVYLYKPYTGNKILYSFKCISKGMEVWGM